MTGDTRYPLAIAREAAETLRDLLAPACERIEIAGSVRRRREMVKDLELVAVPRIDMVSGSNIWGDPEPVDLLESLLAELIADHIGDLGYRLVDVHRADGSIERQYRNGPAYKALTWNDLPVDLFIVRPENGADWGVIFTIRTGPAEYSQRLVTDCQRRFMRVKGGRLLHHGQHVPCPEERDFLAALGEPWKEPWER